MSTDAVPAELRPEERFEIRGRIGHGNMGEITKAFDRILNKEVVLKQVLGAKKKSLAVSRLDREGKILSKLNHKSIAKFEDLITINGELFLIQEYIKGCTLGQFLKYLRLHNDVNIDISHIVNILTSRDTVPEMVIHPSQVIAASEQVTDAIDQGGTDLPTNNTGIHDLDYIAFVSTLIMDVAEALGHVHAERVFHRDLKPDNIMIDEAGQVRVIDFGIAREEEGESLSATADVIGTPCYMSPEQLTGRENVGAASDVFSLGLVLYEALTLQDPYPKDKTLIRLFYLINHHPFWTIEDLNDIVPENLRAIVHKATAKKVKNRYKNGQEMFEDLAKYHAGEAVRARTYRFKQNLAEVAAQRPERVLFAASIYFSVCLMICLVAITELTLLGSATSEPWQKFSGMSLMVGCCAVTAAVGLGLLRAKISALISAPLLALAVAFFLFHGLLTEQGSSFSTSIALIYIVFCVFVTYNAFDPKTWEWVDIARKVEREQTRPKFRR